MRHLAGERDPCLVLAPPQESGEENGAQRSSSFTLEATQLSVFYSCHMLLGGSVAPTLHSMSSNPTGSEVNALHENLI